MQKKPLFCIIVKFCMEKGFSELVESKSRDHLLKKNAIQCSALLSKFPGLQVSPLFISIGQDKIYALVKTAIAVDPGYNPPAFFAYYKIDCPIELNPAAVLHVLLASKLVELAYIQSEPGIAPSTKIKGAFHAQQGYLHPAPVGIGAHCLENWKGGDGRGPLKFIDIEQGWLPHHERVKIKTLPCTGINHYFFEDHGIAVMGIIMMQKNSKGLTGITPKVRAHVVSQWRPDRSFNTADAIMAAVAQLHYGDILLIEAQVCDPASGSTLWPVEVHEAVWQVIRLATALGIAVIETAGNGTLTFTSGNDLDEYMFNGKKILNPQSRDFRNSGAIMVAAATSTAPHTGMSYSNYGKRINCYAWGEQIVTAGSHPRPSGWITDNYTIDFGGTSGAAAIVAGAAIAIQSIRAAKNGSRLTPAQLCKVLSDERYNTASKNGHKKDKIGAMPDLEKNIAYALDGF